MMSKINISKTRKELDLTYQLLCETADFIVDLIHKKDEQLNKLKCQIENGDDSKRDEAETAMKELVSLGNKMEWEKSRILEFEQKAEEFDNQSQEQFIQNLSKNILNPFNDTKIKKPRKTKKNKQNDARKKSKTDK